MLNALNPSRLATDSHIHPTRRTARAPDSSDAGFDPVTTHFQREAARIINASDLLDDRLSLSLMQTALGFEIDPAESRDSQVALISSMINFHDFQIPSKIQQFIQLYNQSGGSAAPEPAHPHVSDSVLAGLQSLHLGG